MSLSLINLITWIKLHNPTRQYTRIACNDKSIKLMYHPNKFTLAFFFFFGAAAKDRQLPTRASLPSAQPNYVGKKYRIED